MTHSKKRKPKPKHKFKWRQKSHFSKRARIAWRLIKIGLGVAITYGGAWAWARPILHIDSARQFNPATPFSVEFKISNDGSFSVYHVGIKCEVNSLGDLHGITVTGRGNLVGGNPPFLDTLEAAGTVSVFCPFDRAVSITGPGRKGQEFQQYAKADVTFILTYRHFLHPFGTKRCFQFLGRLDADGVMQWTHGGNTCPPPL